MDKRAERKLNAAIAPAIANFKPPEDLTVSEWADKYRRLSPEASAEPGPWRTSRTPYLRDIMDAFTDPKVRRLVMVSSSQIGKALALDTPIPTPDGWAQMGDIQPGAKVFDESGRPCTVLAVSEIMHGRKCYEITFSDGAKITADAEHRWDVESFQAIRFEGRRAVYSGVITTDEIAKSYKIVAPNGRHRFKYAIQTSSPLDLPPADLPFPPYSLGVWLGDGNSYSAQVTIAKQDADIIDHMKADGLEIAVEEKAATTYLVRIAPRDPGDLKKPTGHSMLRKLGVIKNKHIPPQYLRASADQRLALLQGIMDTDGSISSVGHCEITLKSKRLIFDVSELLHSLGIKHTIKEKIARCTNSPTNYEGTVYRASFMIYDDVPVFRTERKRARMVSRDSTGKHGGKMRTTETDRRRIVDVKEVESVPVKCISVDSPRHLYLAGREMIPTHNSECILNIIGYIIDQDPGSILFIQPTLDDAKKFSRLRVAPMIRDCKRLKEKVADVKSKDSGNTILQKSFPGGMLTITGSNSASALASTPVRYVLGDERDRWAVSAGTEGDPWGLAMARQATFYNAKAVEVSTPTIKDASNIEYSFNQGTQERWCHQCPECGEWAEITFDRIKFEHVTTRARGKKINKITSGIRWVCPHCACLIAEDVMRRQPARWIAENPDAYSAGVRSFWLNAFASPWTPWTKICQEFLDAQGNIERLKTVYNTLLGQLWEYRGDLPDENEFLQRREDYGTNADGSPVEVPDGVVMLTCGVDVQDNRLEYEVLGHGHYEETWGIKKGYIMHRPDTPEAWQQLTDVIDHLYRFKDSDRGLRISITCIDSGGHFTQEVYTACRALKHKRVFPIKGKGGQDVPYVRPPSKVAIRDNKKITCWLYTIGVDAGKASIMGSLRVQEPGPRFCHFPRGEYYGYDSQYFNGLLSETLETVTTKRGTSLAWVVIPGHERNEALDCRNYALAGLRIINPDTLALEQRLKEMQKASRKPAPKPPAPTRPQRQPKRPTDIYNSW